MYPADDVMFQQMPTPALQRKGEAPTDRPHVSFVSTRTEVNQMNRGFPFYSVKIRILVGRTRAPRSNDNGVYTCLLYTSRCV